MGSLNPATDGVRPFNERQFRLGAWTVLPAINRIETATISVTLEPKVMAVLLELAEAQGQLLSKQHLLKEVWDGVYVVEGVVARSIYQLRKALAKAEDDQDYIETYRASGYRLVQLPVAIANEGKPEPAHPVVVPDHLPDLAPASPAGSYVAALALCCVLAGLIWVSSSTPWASKHSAAAIALSQATITHGTSLKGQESFPRLSRDGQWIAFIRHDAARQKSEILQTPFGQQEPQVVAQVEGRVAAIAYSPERDVIAYSVIRGKGSHKGCSVELLTMADNRSSYLADCGNSSFAHLDWHPSRAQLALAWLEPGKTHSTLDIIDFDAGMTRQSVFEASADQPLLLLPRFSPDGRSLAFGTRANPISSTIWNLDLEDQAPAQKVATLQHPLHGMDWWEASEALIVSLQDRGDTFADLLIVNGPDAGKRTRIDRLDNRFTYLATASSSSTSGSQDRLVGLGRSVDVDLKAISFDQRERASNELLALQSTYSETHPVISPDGSKIAFRSTRNGSTELFLCAIPCTSPMQVSRFGQANGDAGTPSWSPDGTKLVVAAAYKDKSAIVVFDAETGATEFEDRQNEIYRFPAFTADGRRLIYTSERGGTWEPWTLDPATLKASPLGTLKSEKIVPLPFGGYASIRCGERRLDVLGLDLSIEHSFVGLDPPYCYHVEARGQSLYFLSASEESSTDRKSTMEVMEWSLDQAPRSISRIDATDGYLGFSMAPSRDFAVVSVNARLEGNLFLAET